MNFFKFICLNFDNFLIKIIKREKLESFLPAIDVGILIGEGSTAGYLSILFGVPIIIVKNFLRADILITVEDWNQDNGLLVAKQEKDLTHLIMQLLDDNNFKKQTIEKEQWFLDKSLLIRDGKVGERIAKAVSKLENSNEYIDGYNQS